MAFLPLPARVRYVEADEIRAKREARGWTQLELARRVGVGERTIGNWERGMTVPRNRLGKLQELFASPNGSSDPLAGLTDAALLHELLRRAIDRDR